MTSSEGDGTVPDQQNEVPDPRVETLTHRIVESLPPAWSARQKRIVWGLFAAVVVLALLAAAGIVLARAANRTAGQAQSHADRVDREAAAASSAAVANQAAIAAANNRLRSLGGTPVPTPAPVTGAEGPEGPAGRGIVSTQITDGQLLVTYSTGETVDVGQVAGATGPTGPSGPSGSSGRNGSSGANGRGIVSSAVNSSGHLVLTFTDGTSTDVGNVIGPTGATGPSGAPGQAGANGVGVKSVTIANGHLIVTLTDGTADDAGPVPTGPPCPTGYAPATVTPHALQPGTTWVVCQST